MAELRSRYRDSLLDGLRALIINDVCVFTAVDLAETAHVPQSSATKACTRWALNKWLTHIPKIRGMDLYVITEDCPYAPPRDVLTILSAMQLIEPVAFQSFNVFLGYNTALSLHGLTELIPQSIFFIKRSQSIAAPRSDLNDPQMAPFTPSNRKPTVKQVLNNIPIHIILRHNNSLLPQHVQRIHYLGSALPITTPLRTVFDVWTTPSFAGGNERVLHACDIFLHNYFIHHSPDELIRDVTHLLQSNMDNRYDLRKQFISFLGSFDQRLSLSNPLWKDLNYGQSIISQ